MNIRTAIWTGTALLVLSGPAWTQEDDTEVTIRLMGAAEAELPDAVLHSVVLPGELSINAKAVEKAQAAEKAQHGMDTASNPPSNRDEAMEKAAEARSKGAEMSEAAQDNRENHGRSDERPNPPDPGGPPQNPGPP